MPDATPVTERARLPVRAVVITIAIVIALVLLTDLVRRTVHSSPIPAATWNPLEPWLPSLVPARAGYAIAPWPLLLTAGTVATAALLATALTLWCSRLRRRWLTFALLWLGLLAAALVAVGAGEAGEVLLRIQQFGGRGGSWIRTFTIPALIEAARWGALWGWLPALVFVLLRGHVDVPRSALPRTRLLGWLAFLLATAAGLGLAWISHDAAISTQTAVV